MLDHEMISVPLQLNPDELFVHTSIKALGVTNAGDCSYGHNEAVQRSRPEVQ